MQSVREIRGAIKLFAGANARHQIQIKDIDGGPIPLGEVEEPVLQFWRTAIEIVIDEPRSLEVKLVEWESIHDVESAVCVAIVQFIDMRLEVGIADVVVDLRADEDVPLLGGTECMIGTEVLAFKAYGD
jgi:hypothetical protein